MIVVPAADLWNVCNCSLPKYSRAFAPAMGHMLESVG